MSKESDMNKQLNWLTDCTNEHKRLVCVSKERAPRQTDKSKKQSAKHRA